MIYVVRNWTFTVVINHAHEEQCHANYHISYYSIDGPLGGFT